jgi:ATP-binding cassette, subfamily C (CFTR/MRP), member 1
VLTIVVRHLPLADNIIVLDPSGRISEQGSFVYLRQKDGFVSKLMLQPGLLEQSHSKRSSESAQKGHAVLKIFQGPTANDVADRTRRIGDVSVYKYYMAAIGWKLGLWSVVLLALHTVTLKFPRMFLICPLRLIYS